MKYVCVPCRTPYRVADVGFPFEERLLSGQPYRIWMTDLLRCPRCGHEILVAAQEPIAEHWQAEYAKIRAGYGERLMQQQVDAIGRVL